MKGCSHFLGPSDNSGCWAVSSIVCLFCFFPFHKQSPCGHSGLRGLLLPRRKVPSVTRIQLKSKRPCKHPRQLSACVILDKTPCWLTKGCRRSEIPSSGEKSKYFCCQRLSHTVREPHAMATVELNPIKRSANKAGLGVFDLVRAAPASTCQHFSCPALWHHGLCGLRGTCLVTSWRGNDRSACFVFYFQILCTAAVTGLKFNSNYQFHKQWIIHDKQAQCSRSMCARCLCLLFPTHVWTKMEKLN